MHNPLFLLASQVLAPALPPIVPVFPRLGKLLHSRQGILWLEVAISKGEIATSSHKMPCLALRKLSLAHGLFLCYNFNYSRQRNDREKLRFDGQIQRLPAGDPNGV
jgi:hypothetical protein